MLDANLYIFIALCVAVIALILLTLIKAVWHDKAVALAGPLEEERAVSARIEEKRATLLDLENELEARRKALAHIAEIQAEVDALVRQRDELLREWEQSAERRKEVNSVRDEIEKAQISKVELEAQLANATADYEVVKERLERAETLVGQIASLEGRERELSQKVSELYSKAAELEDAEKQLDKLRREHSNIDGLIFEKSSRVESLDQELQVSREQLQSVHVDLDALTSDYAAKKQSQLDLDATVSSLEARKVYLEEQIKLLPSPDGRKSSNEDPMRELKEQPQVIANMLSWDKPQPENEDDALKSVKKRFDAFGLSYPERTLRAFHTSMKVNDTTQMTVLAGISGTGKSQLPRQYAAGMGIGFLQVPVQPRWDSPQDLMGFYNYIEGRFRPTDMARALFAMDEQNNEEGALRDRMMMVLLDEMNLARVEYYFSDFLSRLESRPARDKVGDVNLRKDAEIELEIPNAVTRIFPGYNLLFAGTMNEDESTQSLSDKVVDRANVMRFGAPRSIAQVRQSNEAVPIRALSRAVWDKWCNLPLTGSDLTRVDGAIQEMLGLMQNFGKPFGHRLGRAIKAYATVYPDGDGVGDRIGLALADQIEMRLLPKLRGVDVEECSAEFEKLEKLATKFGDDPLAEAIKQSVEAAETTGQFVWRGVIR
jgi:uncharacterized coiled-coil DUF342 family protein